MKVCLHDRQKDLSISKRSLQKLVEIVLSLHRKTYSQVIIHLVTTREICKLHEQFFDDPSTTDCISFPIDPQAVSSPSILGEIFVCPETAIKYSQARGLNPYRETALYIVHGILHCLGFDDLDPIERKRMRYQERRAMRALEQAAVNLQKSNDTTEASS